jgi:tyrosine-protein kinase Etk/Wzc
MENEQDYVLQSGENILQKIRSKYLPYWPVFLLLLVLCCGGAWLYQRFKVPLYESSATLIVKDEKRGTEDAKIIESLNNLSGKKLIENEIEVIKSRSLLRHVASELNLFSPVYQKAKWKDRSAYVSSPIKVMVLSPDSIKETPKVDFTYNKAGSTVTVGDSSYPLNKWVRTRWGNLRFEVNNPLYDSAGKFYFALVHPKRVTQNLINTIDVNALSKMSSVVTLKTRDEVPERSEDILNRLIAAYNKAALTDKNTLTANTLKFLDERLTAVSDDLRNIEQRMQKYRADKGAIDISSQGQLFLKNVSDNDQKLSDVNMKLAVLDQVEQYVNSKNNNGGLVPSTLGISDTFLTGLLDNLYETELEYEKLKRTTGENNPMAASVADKIEKIKPSILENIRNQRKTLEASKKNLYTTNKDYTTVLQGLPQQERDLVEISREQNIKSTIYSFLLQKREETALSNSSSVVDSKIVDKAESSLDPVSSGKLILYLLAAALAFALGNIYVYLKESLNNKILFRQEIESMSSFPVIGEIIQQKSREPLVLKENTRSFISEQFRMIRNSLPYLGIGSKGGKKILVTSTVSGDGKSFVCANLGLSLAMTGKRVVLVEFDLSNPTLSSKLNMENTRGVTEYLTGEADANEVIAKVEANPNLYFISAGDIPENPADLILSDRTNALLNYLDQWFDYVIIDSAPVGLLSDGYVLSEKCDATLFVVRHGHTPKKMLKRIEENNRINELKNVALVFNGVRSRGFSKNGYGQGYGYGYIYQQERRGKRVLMYNN